MAGITLKMNIIQRVVRPSALPRMGVAQFRTTSVAASELYTERQAKLNRPVSPHVTIYAFPIVSISSITNRVTGVMLSIGVSGMGCLTAAGVDVAALATTLGESPVAPVFKLAVAFPLVYHYLGGVRHMVWDKSPDILTNEEVETSSKILVGASVALSLGCAAL